jgi:hypothetical protein
MRRAAENKHAGIPGGREATGSLSVSLRAEPRDLAVSVHPIVNVGLALETPDFSWFGACVLGDDRPIIIRVMNRLERHFCFCHVAHYAANAFEREPALRMAGDKKLLRRPPAPD